jgi:glycosyltransferase involved in cell wall biosynthesis
MLTPTGPPNRENLVISREANLERHPLITLAISDIGLGGAELANVVLAKQFLNRGFRVDIVTAGDFPGARALIPSATRYIVLGARRTREFLLPFARYLRRERPEAVIASIWPLTTTCVLAHQFARSRARMVVWEHNTLSDQYRVRGAAHRIMLKSSIALTYPLAHARVAVSMGVADDLAALSGISRGGISVIHNPVPTSFRVATGYAKAETVWGSWRGPRIITVGRLKAQKNHALLIRAFGKMLSMLDARLLILGTGELAEATAAVARAEGVADKVLMPGETIDPTPYYRSADLFVLSSDYEGLGNVIVEALACGVPVVSTNCRSGPSEILENGRYGRLVPVGDADALARAMADALAAKHDREALKRRAADFAPELIVEEYLRVLFPRSVDALFAASAHQVA